MEEAWELAAVNSFERIATILESIRGVSCGPNTSSHTVLNSCELPDSLNSDDELYDFDARHVLRALYIYIDKAEQELFAATNLSSNLLQVSRSKLRDAEELLSQMHTREAWQTIRRSYLPASLIDSLRLTGGMLSASGIKYDLTNQDISELRQEIGSIIDGIKNSGLPDQLKQMLIANLLKIQFILETYDSLGPRDLENQVKILIADTTLGSKQVSEEDVESLSTTWAFAGKILQRFHTGVGYLKSSEYMIGLLMLVGKGS
ncbi:MAG: hypothetical protein WBF53_13750 [Litorimonas sp.]